jgi:hypothetical protein
MYVYIYIYIYMRERERFLLSGEQISCAEAVLQEGTASTRARARTHARTQRLIRQPVVKKAASCQVLVVREANLLRRGDGPSVGQAGKQARPHALSLALSDTHAKACTHARLHVCTHARRKTRGNTTDSKGACRTLHTGGNAGAGMLRNTFFAPFHVLLHVLHAGG